MSAAVCGTALCILMSCLFQKSGILQISCIIHEFQGFVVLKIKVQVITESKGKLDSVRVSHPFHISSLFHFLSISYLVPMSCTLRSGTHGVLTQASQLASLLASKFPRECVWEEKTSLTCVEKYEQVSSSRQVYPAFSCG